MTTTDGNIYTLKNVALVPGALKFRGNHSWDLPYNWGGTDFPSGTAVVDANPITVPTAGNYDITFNKNDCEYSLLFQQLHLNNQYIWGCNSGMLGITDTDMTTTDGIIYTLNGVSLSSGALKFRGDHAWDFAV